MNTFDVQSRDGACRLRVYALTTVLTSDDPRVIVLCMHGLNASGLAFEPFARAVSALSPNLAIFSFDARGHGSSTYEGTPPSSTVLTSDVLDVLLEITARHPTAHAAVLVGHSLGGALAVRAAAAWPASAPPLRGLVAIEACEGSTVLALPAMRALLRAQPRAFASVDECVEFAVAAGLSRRAATARAVLLARLRVDGGGRATWAAQAFVDAACAEGVFEEYFAGTTALLLSLPRTVLRLLIVGAREHLFGDQKLTVALTQGKLASLVVPAAGHAVHEDEPAAVAAAVAALIARALAPLPSSPA
jgi:pimeloyl-ACP methyl ester carboxylesterase